MCIASVFEGRTVWQFDASTIADSCSLSLAFLNICKYFQAHPNTGTTPRRSPRSGKRPRNGPDGGTRAKTSVLKRENGRRNFTNPIVQVEAEKAKKKAG